MGNELKLILLIIWLPQAIFQSLTWLYWWQDKEYRSDRFQAFLKTIDGRREQKLVLVFLKFILLLASIYVSDLIFGYLILLVWLDASFLYGLYRKVFRKPVFTARALNILAIELLIIISVLLFFSNVIGFSVFLIITEFSLIISMYIGSLATGILASIAKKKVIKEASEKLEKIKPVIIAVTGSYGKTTTKEFIAQILSSKYKVVKTLGSQNTIFGVMRGILSSLNEKTEYIVAEVGAYKKGEIKEIARILKPDISVVTGIEPQHLELFGDFDGLMDAKYELVEETKGRGVVIFNFSNQFCRKLYKRTQKERLDLQLMSYAVWENEEIEADAKARVISFDHNGVEFMFDYQGHQETFKAKVYGKHFVENLACAILIGREFGLSWAEIKKAVSKVILPEKTMNVYKLKNNLVVIDDSYNTTPKGFKKALDYLKLFKNKKKVIFTTGIIELGRESYEVHKKLGRAMRGWIGKIVLRNEQYSKPIKDGLGEDSSKLEVISDPVVFGKVFEESLQKDHAILLEGKLPAILFKIMEKYK